MSKEIPGDRVYTKRTVEELISNPFYYGDLKINGVIVNKGIHEPLISKQLWNSCQKVRGIRAASKRLNPDKAMITKAMMGLMTCGSCNHAITGETKKVKSRVYIYYRCANHGCEERRTYYREDRIMALIAEAFSPFQKFTPEATRAFLDTMSSKLEDLHYYTEREQG